MKLHARRFAAHLAGASCLATTAALFPPASLSACSRAEDANAAQVAPPLGQEVPRRPIDGLHGVETRSTLRYADLPDTTRSFEAVYVFPDRARWEFELANGEQRRVYRSGAELFFTQGGPSLTLDEPQRDRLIGELELRRALLVWPHGFEWKETEGGSEVDLGLSGRLHATVDAKTGLPLTLSLRAPDGTTLESFRKLAWRTDRGRRWPASLEFWHGSSHLWDETFERATPARYVDSFFVPADRRDDADAVESAQGEQPLQAFTSLRVDLPADTSWEDALKLEAEARERWAKKLPEAALADRPTFLIGETGKPLAALLRIEPPARPAPAGWTQQGARRGVTSFVPYKTLSDLDRERVLWMRSQVPAGKRAATPYVRVDPEGGLAQLVQPIDEP